MNYVLSAHFLMSCAFHFVQRLLLYWCVKSFGHLTLMTVIRCSKKLSEKSMGGSHDAPFQSRSEADLLVSDSFTILDFLILTFPTMQSCT